MKTSLLLLILSTTLYSAEPLKLYIESTVYFIPKDSTKVKDISRMLKFYDGFNEIASSADEPSGEWHMQTRLSESNVYNIVMWIDDKNNPVINQDFDVSRLEMNTFSLLKNNKGELKINIVPKLIEEELEAIKLDANNFGLTSFCFKNSAMIIDDNFYIGKLMGFAERAEIRIPDFYDIDLALMPLRDWDVIGTYTDGIINIDIDNDHLLTLLNVGVGPSGYKKGGPFNIYGKIKAPTHDREKLLSTVEDYDFRDTSKRIKRIIMKANRENKYSVAGITTANEHSNSKHLVRAIGNFFTDEDCG